MTAAPAVVIAAPASGSGKTTVATGLMGALGRAGHRVAPFKIGPDYIDPGYHTLAAGRLGRNLDPVLVGEELIGPLYAAGTADADLAVVEGVMGLFDGRIDEHGAMSAAEGSTARVAALLGAPVILVVDAAGHSQSMAALLHGFVSFDAAVAIGGVIFNRVGSARHEFVLRQAAQRVGLPVFGVIRRDIALAVPSRHLGLIPAAERRPAAQNAVTAMTDLIADGLDLPGIVATARTSVAAAPWSATDAVAHHIARTPEAARPVVAVAGGAAFTFGYAEQVELLTAAGADVVAFDPLTDRLPAGACAAVIGGGFPEEYAEQLAANEPLRADLRALAHTGRPIYGECAGLLYLAHELDGHPMAGVLPVRGMFGDHLTLGYRDAVAVTDSCFFRAGTRVTGHEFHRSVVLRDPAETADDAWGWRAGARMVTDGVIRGSVLGSYLHLHPAAHPGLIAGLVRAGRGATADIRD
ncbi:cobyrinate a,c-diamide synthase [Williamsia sterculiae]|uniref:cobyrinate a,c-diamide synthase n=1 Tax=Williamsia sterculiae TaxID=1344003 RepID=UPI000970A494|nr:cobyrinate a,c-diamide synthase [Williamsia sterculiae]